MKYRWRALILFLSLSGCAGEPNDNDTDSEAPETSAGDTDIDGGVPPEGDTDTERPAFSTGCGGLPPLEGHTTVSVEGQPERGYVLDLPTAYDPATPYPLVFGFHGAATTGANFQLYFLPTGDPADDAVIVYPDGLDRGVGTVWEYMGEENEDLYFFDVLLAALEESLCIDRSRIFAVGHSLGGFFSNHLGCTRGHRLRAVASVSGGGPLQEQCRGQVAAWMTHNPADQVVPFSFAEESRDFWRVRNGCGETDRPTDPASVCVALDGCLPRYPVHFCPHNEEEEVGPHWWPSFATSAIWDFFGRLEP